MFDDLIDLIERDRRQGKGLRRTRWRDLVARVLGGDDDHHRDDRARSTARYRDDSKTTGTDAKRPSARSLT